MLYEIKVQLEYINPPVWRVLQIPAGTSLFKLHKLLQKAMGWSNSHLYLFEAGKKRYSEYPEDWDMEVIDSKKMTLEQLYSEGITSFIYEYDMGDGWRHEITVTGTVESKGKEEAACIAGARACPPEDCGGPPGYEDFLEVIANPYHEDHEEMLEWIGGTWDPEAFDLATVNRKVKRVR